MKRIVIFLLSFPMSVAWGGSENILSTPTAIQESIQHYWGGVKCINTRFTQTNPDGTQWKGYLWLDRTTGFIMIECWNNQGERIQTLHNAPPDIKSNKKLIPSSTIKIENHLDETESVIDVQSTPLSLFLKNPIDWSASPLTGGKKIGRHYQAYLTVNDIQVTLFFSPLGIGIGILQGWEIMDLNNKKTTVIFDPETLSINDPEFYKHQEFYRKEIKKFEKTPH